MNFDRLLVADSGLSIRHISANMNVRFGRKQTVKASLTLVRRYLR